MDEMPRVSNGAKALHIASEHWARVEQELDEVTAKLEEREQKLATALGRIAELSEQLNRAEQRGNAWMLKCGADGADRHQCAQRSWSMEAGRLARHHRRPSSTAKSSSGRGTADQRRR